MKKLCMLTFSAVVLFLLTGGFGTAIKTYGQSAIVFSLTANETEEGERLYLNMNQAKAMYDSYVERIGAKYLESSTSLTIYQDGLRRSHDKASFSKDFKHVMPDPGLGSWNGQTIHGPCMSPAGSSVITIPAIGSTSSRGINGTTIMGTTADTIVNHGETTEGHARKWSLPLPAVARPGTGFYGTYPATTFKCLAGCSQRVDTPR